MSESVRAPIGQHMDANRGDAASRGLRAWLLLLCVAGVVIAARFTADATHTSDAWLRVARDANYDIAIDTTDISTYGRNAYVVWYRTDHAALRIHDGKPFDREVVRSIIRCDSLWFKVASVDMSLGGGSPIVRQRMDARDIAGERWRRVTRGTSEEIAAQAACFYARRKEAAKPGPTDG